jgi:6-pyruvoyl-tetrahydropterin synthase
MKQFITRKGTFDFGHRVLNHRKSLNKCCNAHGHTARWELTLEFESLNLDFGYVIDFSEIKRQFDGFIQSYLDHGWISNPKDPLLDSMIRENCKVWILSLNDSESCNPSCENISKELFYVATKLFENFAFTKVYELKLYETENSFVTTRSLEKSEVETLDKSSTLKRRICEWILANPAFEYDERKLTERK